VDKAQVKKLISRSWSSAKEVYKTFVFFIKQCLGSKKIVIISEKGISSLPVSFKFQAGVACGFLAFMLWVSYSTGKYFAYEGIISEKDREIWSTNITNENLQYKVADLHDNLAELNKYFDNIRRMDKVAAKKVFEGDASDSDNAKVADASDYNTVSKAQEGANGVQNILQNIRGKVLERINSLESIIEMTGLKVEQVALSNEKLKRVFIENGSSSNQGGAYIPLDDEEFNNMDFDKEVGYLMQLEKVVYSFPLASPMKHYWVSSRYGTRVDPIKGRAAMHAGIDLVGRYKSNVYSSAPGVVKRAGTYGSYGRFIEVDHGSGITTRYGHLNKILVKKGDILERGDLIGLQGNSGRSTGTHLHYEVRYNNKSYDPEKFLTAGKYVF